MLLPRFAYHRPQGLAEAVEILAERPGARVLAGGTDLLVNLKRGSARASEVVDVSGLEELAGLRSGRGRLFIGAATTAATIAGGRALAHGLRLLVLGARSLGSPQVRNRATLGGNLATARPAGDLLPALLCLEARVQTAGPQGEREVPAFSFFLGPGQTVLEPAEIVRGVRLERPGPGSGGGYHKLGVRRALEIALVSAAAFLALEADGKTVAQARVALGAVAPTPIRATGAEQVLVGRKAGEKLFARAGEAAAADAKPIDDHRGSADYRRQMVAVLAQRALRDAWLQARG
jgi:carbon-monoxide dehydrogenase medium subunit